MTAGPAAAAAPRPFDETTLARRWAGAPRGPLRLEDGRALRIVFPGVPGGAAGPDFSGAILDAGGDILRGDVEIHLRASGWHSHGHGEDPAYHGVVLHVVGENDGASMATHHRGRAIPILVLRLAGAPEFPPPFMPPCAFARAAEVPVHERLDGLGLRRLRMKAARYGPLAASAGPGAALYTALLEALAGPANRAPFAALARMLPLPALLERLPRGGERALAASAHLEGAAAGLALRRAGLRPMASPRRRLEAAGALVARLWPGPEAGWPLATPDGLAAVLRGPGVGRGLAVELAVNAVLPVALASRAWSGEDVAAAWRALPAPGTYGKLRALEGWLGGRGAAPFATASRLQGGLLLHADYCTAGRCGRCPLS